jgi:hypothetical protein
VTQKVMLLSNDTFNLLSATSLIHEGLEASKSSLCHFFISQPMFQKSEALEVIEALEQATDKTPLCGLTSSARAPVSSNIHHQAKVPNSPIS